MTDDPRGTPPGPGWWLASDGQWYPPESQPGGEWPTSDPGFTGPTVEKRALARRDLAGFWRRFGALLLDGLIIGIPTWIVTAVITSQLPTEIEPCEIDGELFLCENYTAGSWLVIILLNVVVGLGSLLGYYAYFIGTRGATLGKKAAGVAVVDERTGDWIGFGRAAGRELFKIISAAVLLLGFLWAIWDKEKRTWHDMVVSSRVVRTR